MAEPIEEQMSQVYTTYTAMIPALIQKLVANGALPPSDAATLFRNAEALLRSGSVTGQVIDEGAKGLASMAAKMDALPPRPTH